MVDAPLAPPALRERPLRGPLVGYALVLAAVRRLGAAIVAMVEPVLAALVAFLWLREELGAAARRRRPRSRRRRPRADGARRTLTAARDR